MKTTRFISATVLPLLTILPMLVSAQVRMPKSILASGASDMSNATHRLRATIGQPVIGAAQSAQNRGLFGFWYDRESVSVSVERLSMEIPQEMRLDRVFPNPVAGKASVRYAISKSAHLTLTICDAMGCSIATLVDHRVEAGEYIVSFNSRALVPGMYFLRMMSGAAQNITGLIVSN